ncbi:hypothetical protein V2A60_003895 [Cordyceps javanica]|uniref:Uncharacterized protein n=1 Tax=Cordyceps javanica TaxID=43265 RepID=A0A545UWV6_9HYPO|nr:hypothetical protein IF1G_07685 [Cordyceps javanica]
MRTAKTKTGSLKTVSGPKRICQDRTPSDATTPKAMKDPNWRTRQDTGSSTDIENIMPPAEHFNSKIYPQAAEFQSNHTSQHDRSSSEFSLLDRSSSESSSTSENFVKIVKKIDLKPIQGRKMSIFELDIHQETPTPTIAGDDRRYVKVSRNSSSHQRDSSSASEVSEPSANSGKAHTPDLFQVVTLDRLCRQSSSSNSAHTPLHESRSIYERDKDSSNPVEQTVPVVQDRLQVDETQSPQTAIRHSRDQAFRRLIQRLNRDNHSAVTRAPQSPLKNQTRHKPPGPEAINKSMESFRRPVAGQGRRNQTISDFKVDYWGKSQSSINSCEGSENAVQALTKQNAWNPKAREFLSLGHQQNPRRPLPWDTSVPVMPEKVSHNLNSLPQPTTAAWLKDNTLSLNPYLPPQDQASIPTCSFNPQVVPLSPGFNLALGSETFGTSQYLPGNAAPQPPFFAVPPLPGVQAPMMPFGNLAAHQLAAQQLAAQQLAAQQIAAIPYLASLASLGPLPLLNGLEKPQFAANSRRPPVPKPTLPNAGAQLAYEEWIEWRKAHEPGYAVECKARQQRRSQRSKGPKDGGGDKPAESVAPARAVAAA